jgi:GNAT superfamily N-acetyltransferase
MISTQIVIRPVRCDDFAVICAHRRLMFAEMGTAAATLDLASEAYAAWLAPRLTDGRYFGFFAEDQGAVIGGVGLRIMDFPPNPNHPATDQRGFVLDMYVQPEYRGRGIAADLMRRAEKEMQERGIVYATLQASEMGRPLYEKLGWGATSEMGKVLG